VLKHPQPVSPVASSPSDDHPLTPALSLAKQAQQYAEKHVQGFRCQLIKRERIDGELQPERVIEICVREGSSQCGPYAARLDFLAPNEVTGRRILYVDGEHDNKMLVRKGGRRLNYIVLRLDPEGFKAKAESLAPVTQIGYRRMMAAIVETLERQIEIDTAGTNTHVEWMDATELNGQLGRLIRITHPERDPALCFYQAEVLLHLEHELPVRIALFDWPEDSGQPALIAEYTYQNLELCEAIPPDAFTAAALGSR
jgi:hypothetical protein